MLDPTTSLLDILSLFLGRAVLIIGGLLAFAWLVVYPVGWAADAIYRRMHCTGAFLAFLSKRMADERKKKGNKADA